MYRNKILFLVCVLANVFFLSLKPEEEYFEGFITYNIYADGSVKESLIQSFRDAFGNKTIFYFKNGDYKQVYNGNLISIEYYNHVSNQRDMQYVGSDTFQESDGSKDADSLLNSTHIKSVKEIAGYTCDEFIFNFKSGIHMQAFYNEEARKLNPEWFNNPKAGYLNIVYSRIKSIPLEMIVSKDNFDVYLFAERITRKTLTDDEVHLPKNAIVKNL